MVDRGRQPGLAQEPISEPLAVRELGREQLEGNPPLQPGVLGQVHHAHADPTDHPVDAEAGELGPDARVLGHRGGF
jgi:hypothetical protein